jgi:cold shock protein
MAQPIGQPYGMMSVALHGCDRVSERRYGAERQATMTGSIRTLRVEKGFGFIKDDAGKEYFFHRSAVYGEGLENLKEGDGVEFDLGEGPKGPRAENVRRTTT